jgi:uncharacterized protein
MLEGSYIEAWRERWSRRAAERARVAEHARVVAGEIAHLLRQHYGARRVILIGSLARGEFRPDSDIDLVVDGIEPRLFLRAGADAERSAHGFDVDLVPFESAAPAMREQLAREGIPLA